MLARMRRIDVVAQRAVAGQVVRAVHRAGVVHLVPFEPPTGIGSTTFAGSMEEMPATTFDAALQAVSELEAQLGRLGEPSGPAEDGRADARTVAPLDEIWDLADGELLARVDLLRSVRAEVERLIDDRLRLGGEIARLDSYRSLVGGLQSVLGHLPSVRGYATTGLVVGARYRSVLGAIGAELERVTGGRCEVVSADIGTDRIGAVLIYPHSMAADVRGLLGGRDIEEVSLPDDLAGVPFEELGPRLTAARDRLTAARVEREAGLASLRTRHGPEIGALRLVLGDRIAERRALAAAGASDHLVVLSGWLPDRELAGLRDELARVVGGSVEVIERTGEKPTRDAPVALQNLPVLRAFEPLASFTVVPRYGSLDPTPLLALALPAFIGLMVGDAGYGLILLAILALIRWRRPRSPLVRRVWPIGLVAAVSTIGFGILFGEWFGDAGATLFGIRPIWLDRREAVDELLILAIAIGIGQVGLGLVLGIVNSALMRRRRELAGRATLLVCAIAILVAIASLLRFVPEQVGIVAVAAAVIALVLLVLAVGLTGPIEVVGVLGNVLSYARLMAIGVASVMLGLVANRLGGLVENAIAGLLVAGAVHVLNFVLGFFDASVQGVRLQYVEFFTKFVEPGGVRYAPFASVLNTPAGALRRLPGGT